MALTREQIQKRKSELKAMKENPDLEKQDMIHRLAKSFPVQSILGAGDTIRNQTNAIATTLTGGLLPYKPVKTGEGFGYEAGKLGMNIAETFIPSTGFGRIAFSTGIGGLTNPENPLHGLQEGAFFGALGEALGPITKGAGTLARESIIEPLSLDKLSAQMSEHIKKGFDFAKEKSWGTVGPILKKFGGEKLLIPGAYGEMQEAGMKSFTTLFDEKKDLFSADFKKLKKEFDRSPTIENAQNMVEKLGIDERKIRFSDDPAKDLKVESYRESKDLIRDTMKNRMEQLSPGFGESYDKANLEYAKNVAPYRSSDVIESAAAGNLERASELYKSIGEESKKVMGGYPAIPEEHYLKVLEGKMKNPIGISEMVPQGVSQLIPFMGTQASRESIYGGISGGHKMLEPYLRALVQAPSSPVTEKFKEEARK